MLLLGLALALPSVSFAVSADASIAGGARELPGETYTILVFTPTRVVTGSDCRPVEFGLRPLDGRTVADCRKLSSSPLQSDPGLGGGHVLRLSQSADVTFLSCSFERAERLRRSDGSFENYLEFGCAETPQGDRLMR